MLFKYNHRSENRPLIVNEVYLMNNLMNKKKICLIALVLAVFFLNACGIPDDWKTIEIEGFGNIQVPESWEVSIKDGFTYIFSEEGGEKTNILVQYWYIRDTGNKTNEIFLGIEEVVHRYGEVFSNSAYIGKSEVYYQDGSSEEMFDLEFTGPNYDTTIFYCMDDTISEDTLRMVAKSYNQSGDGSVIDSLIEAFD